MLGYAENMLMDELALSYNIERDKVKAFIEKKIK